MGRKVARLGSTIAAKGPGFSNSKDVHGHSLTADQYAQQRQPASQRFVTILDKETPNYTYHSQPAPKPRRVVIKKGSTGSIRAGSLKLKRSQLEQDLHAQVIRSKQALPICNDVCSPLTVQALYEGLLACKDSHLQRLLNDLSLKNVDQVDWLLETPDCFEYLSLLGSACVLRDDDDKDHQQQQSSAAENTICAMKTKLPGCSSNKATAKPNLGRTCRRLLSGFASGCGKMSGQVIKTACMGMGIMPIVWAFTKQSS